LQEISAGTLPADFFFQKVVQMAAAESVICRLSTTGAKTSKC
jgi:hypothetical protein